MAIPNHLKRILLALDLEKHMTCRQLAQLLYPEEPIKTTYERVAKNLSKLQKENLLKSKSYGLGKEKLWSLKPNPINKEEGFTPPKAEVHTYKYEHERACAEVFVKFAQDEIYGWDQHKKISKEIIPDRTVYLTEDYPLYIEVEMGDRDRVTQKISNYQRYYRETHEKFRVLFLVKQMRDWPKNPHYQIEILEKWIENDSRNHSD